MIYTTPITDLAEAQDFFRRLSHAGKLFHPEADPAEVSDAGICIFTPDEVVEVRKRIDEVYQFMPDPCDFILATASLTWG